MEMTLALVALLAAFAAIGFSFFQAQKIQELQKRVDLSFDENLELANQLKKLRISADEVKISTTEVQTYSRPVAPKPQPVRPKPTKVHEENVSEADKSLWQDVIFLAQQGVSADKIAKDLNITRGEVDLILSLQNFNPDRK